MTPPILFLTFNRPDTTTRVFAAIRAAQPARLYVASDGPRADRMGEAELCAEVRRIATAVDWPCEVKTLFRDRNLGCRRAVSGAITWFFEHEEEGIILEDDCLPSPDFFPWCNAMLERYRDERQIMCVTGNNFQSDMKGWPYSYYYSIFNHCWGWASWRRAWELYDTELQELDPERSVRHIDRLCGVRGFGKYWVQILERVKAGQIDSWAYIWTWSCFKQGGLTCTPKVNLVSNIGFGENASNTLNSESPHSNLRAYSLSLPFIAPPQKRPESRFDRFAAQFHFGIEALTLFERAKRKFRRMYHIIRKKGTRHERAKQSGH